MLITAHALRARLLGSSSLSDVVNSLLHLVAPAALRGDMKSLTESLISWGYRRRRDRVAFNER